MELPEQQEYINQISLIQSRIIHLEESMKIEDQEKRLEEKIKFHKENSAKDAALRARKEEENASQKLQLEKEEEARHDIVDEMVKSNGNNISKMKDVLVHFEGILNLFTLTQLLIIVLK